MKEYDLKDLLLLDPTDKKQVKSNTINETGNHYGALEVIGCTRLPTDRKLSWVCKCKCGRIVCVYGSDLRHNRITSCGHRCDKIEDLTGRIFGNLKVIELDPALPKTFPDHMYHWICECQVCHNIISVNHRNLKNGSTKSCGCIKSRGEFKIRQLLIENNIPFVNEKSFNNCKFPNSNAYAKFDFYVNNHYLIEYDGEQHYIETFWHHDLTLQDRQQRDKYKNQWCKENNIPLIRIPYTYLDKITIDDLKLETSKFIIGEK